MTAPDYELVDVPVLVEAATSSRQPVWRVTVLGDQDLTATDTTLHGALGLCRVAIERALAEGRELTIASGWSVRSECPHAVWRIPVKLPLYHVKEDTCR